jgi:hypothetical protein
MEVRNMKKSSFLTSIREDKAPPKDSSSSLAALWWIEKGDWNKAHDLAEADKTADGYWVHAYLHRVEGDIGNATYWYTRAGRAVSTDPFPEEWNLIVEELLAK